MSTQKPRLAIRGSERTAPQGTEIGAPDPNERIAVTVRLRRRTPLPDGASLESLSAAAAPRHHVSHEEYAAAHGADPEDIAKVEEFAHEHGLTPVQTSIACRSVILAGT